MESLTSTYDKVKIHEALELLDAAAAEGHSDLKDIIGDNYESFKHFAASLGNNIQRELSGVYAAGKAKVRGAAGEVDRHVHVNPWAYIGGSAALGILIGVLIARSRK
jgi:ElaB/YqjD/DUF883 family membrane-anchored ribosome-binding protein